MLKASFFLLAFIVVIASVGVVGWSFFGWSTPPFAQTQQVPQPTGKPRSGKIISLPISEMNKSIKSVRVSYIFVGTIKDIRKVSQGSELVTDVAGYTPQFIVGSDTKIIFKGDDKKEASSSALVPNQQVEIHIDYKARQGVWNDVKKVVIL